VLPKSQHPKLDGLLLERDGRRPFVNQITQGVSDFHELVNSFPSLVAGVIARLASSTIIKPVSAQFCAAQTQLVENGRFRLVGGAAIRTDASEQSLAEHCLQG